MKDKNDPKTLIKTVKSGEAERLIKDKVVNSGMIPKTEACVSAVKGGVKKSHILDAGIEHAMLLEIFTDMKVLERKS